MIIVSQLIDLACRIGGPRFAHEILLRRLERWRTFESEYFLLDHLVDPQRAAVDVGANEGIYTGRLAQLCPLVHCFEPIPWLAADLRVKLRPSVIVHEAAASNRTGSGELRIPYRDEIEMHGTSTIEPSNPLDDSTHVKVVPCRLETLDTAVREPVGLIKIDVEGHELAVLQGAVELIRRDRPVLLVETEKRHSPDAPESIFAFLGSLGYCGCFLQDERPWALSAFKPQQHQSPANLAGGTHKIGTYINNFIFIPGAVP
jgi:FkbM family methyltransferase